MKFHFSPQLITNVNRRSFRKITFDPNKHKIYTYGPKTVATTCNHKYLQQ
ncbi:hypothetical protein Hanom_Chr12g01108001 [Helianthus anomalus]